MKRILYLVCITFLQLQSCSSESNTDNSSSNEIVLLKKVTTGTNGSQTFSYEGDKLVAISTLVNGESTSIKNSYTGGLITKIQAFDKNNQASYYITYNYTNGKLTQTKDYTSSSPTSLTVTTDFIYNPDGSVTLNMKGNGIDYTNKCYFDNYGNLIKYEENIGSKSTTFFEYDKKNNPFKNVRGFNPFIFGPSGGLWSMSTNNVTKNYSTWTGQTYTQFESIYQYNSQDYPMSSSITSSGITTLATYSY
jgi:hypothetical protein